MKSKGSLTSAWQRPIMYKNIDVQRVKGMEICKLGTKLVEYVHT